LPTLAAKKKQLGQGWRIPKLGVHASMV